MQLFKVRISWETVIRAKDAGEAEELAPQVIRDGDEPHDECDSESIESLADLPPGWDADCRPWGETDSMDRTIGEILGTTPNPEA